MTTLQIIAWSFVALVVFTAIIGWVFIKVKRPYRQAELQFYWDAFHEFQCCKESLKFYPRGRFIFKFYGLSLPKGCADEKAFHDAAIQSLVRAIEISENDEAIRLRADLALLMLIHATDEEKAVAANQSITLKIG